MPRRKYLPLVLGIVLASVAHVALEEIRFSRVTYPSFDRDEKVCRTHNAPLETLFHSEWIESPGGSGGPLCTSLTAKRDLFSSQHLRQACPTFDGNSPGPAKHDLFPTSRRPKHSTEHNKHPTHTIISQAKPS